MEDQANEMPQSCAGAKSKRRRKDPTLLLKHLREARLQGPPDWATNIDDYIYGGKRPEIADREDDGEQTE